MRIVAIALVLSACGGDDATSGDDVVDPPDAAVVAPACDPIEVTGTPVIIVSPDEAGALGQIISDAPAGAVIELRDGTYPVQGDVIANLSKPVTLVGMSRDASRVVIDGGAYEAREILQVTSRDVTIAHLTIRRARDHLIHLYPGGAEDLDDIVIHGVILEDAGQQFVKSNASSADYTTARFVDGVTVACSAFVMTPAGRAYVPTNPDNASYPCYTGGIDAHAAWNWRVVRNTFDGIYCDVDSLAEHAIHFWKSGRDQVIEQNVIGNCARGIGLGLTDGAGLQERAYADDPHRADRVAPYVGNLDGVIRNNVVWADVAGFDSGISVEQALGVRVYHNTVVVSGAASGNAIEYRWPNSLVDIRNNLSTSVVVRDGASGTVRLNLAAPPDAFDATWHATDGAPGLDLGEVVAEAGLDLDGDPHDAGAGPDLGADER